MTATTPMTYEDMYDLLTNLLDGDTIDDTLFGTLLNSVRAEIEGNRPWLILKKVDKSITVPSNSTWLTPYSLPDDFSEFVDASKSKIQLFDVASNKLQDYTQIPYEDILDYKDDNNVFAVDYSTNKLYLMGIVDQSYVMYIPYIRDSGDIVAGGTWPFPARFHKILPYGVSVLQKAGIDYDDQYARMALNNDKTFQNLLSAMKKWDSRLQLASNQQRDYGGNGNTFRSGSININDPYNG